MTIANLGKSVSITRLDKSYGRHQVLCDINLGIAAGEFCTLLGASGSGKTTLLKVLAGFEPFDRGAIRVGSRDIGGVPVARRNIGMVFQNYALFPHMTVRRNVAFGLEMRGVEASQIRRRVDEVLDLVSLGTFSERLPASLSGGQQQRVALARALVINPDILLMDEPLGALDKNLRQTIQLQLKALHRELGITIVYVTHDQEEALTLSDTIVIMDGGRIVQTGGTRELYFRPVNAFVAGFLGECNFLTDEDGTAFGIRPENLALGDPQQGSARRLGAVVDDVIFLGTGTKVVARHQDERIIAAIGNDPRSAAVRPGDPIELVFRDEHMLRF